MKGPGIYRGIQRMNSLSQERENMLILNDRDISKAVSLNQITTAVEAALMLYEKGDFHMPQRTHVDYQGNTLLLMPCFTRDIFSTKLVSLFPGNIEKGLPVLMGTVILNHGETGQPLALLNGAKLTALRTGAVGACGVRHLSPLDTHKVGIIGAGVQGFHQALFACAEREISDLYVFDSVPVKQDEAIRMLADSLPEVKVHWAESVEELLEETQLIITATNSATPVLPDEEKLLAGKHFIGIGSYKSEMREFPDALFKIVNQFVVDTRHAFEEWGDLKDPLAKKLIKPEQIVTMGRLLGGKPGTVNVASGTSLFKSVGMALFDLFVADLVYREAQKKGIGTEIDM